jgi:hypothetical protein
MAQYTQIVCSIQVFGRGKRKKTGGHLMYRTPALNHYLTLLISCIMSTSKVSLGKVDSIIEKGEKNQPLFMKEGDHEVKLIGKGTWGAKASACILTDKGTIGAFQLIDQMRKDSILDQFLEDGEFVFEIGTELHLTIAAKAVVETRIPVPQN